MKIRTKIFISLFTLIFIIIGLLAGVYFIHINNLLVEDRFEALENLAVNTGDEVKRFMSRGYLDIQLLSENPTLKSNSATTEEKLELLDLVESTYGIYDDISLIDLDGIIITSTSYIFEGNLEKKEWFQKAKEGNITISNAHMITDPKEVVVDYLSPVINDEGHITSVVSIRFPLRHLWFDIDNIEIGKEGFICIINSFNMYIAHPDKELILTAPPEHIPFDKMTQKKGIVEYLDLDKTEVVASFCTLFETEDYKQKGWRVVVIQPKEEIMLIINQSNAILILITCVGIIGIIGISYFLTRTVTKPINALKEHTLKIRKGELDTKINLVSKDELADLEDSFNRMTDDLKKSRVEIENHSKTLEKKVAERTKELEKSKNKLDGKVIELQQSKSALLNIMNDLETAQKELEILNVGLEQKVKERTAEVNNLLQQKDEFINQLSHDLRTPLTPLMNLIPLLEKTEKDPKSKELFEVLRRSINRMKNLVIKTLKLAELNAPSTILDMENINLWEEAEISIKDQQLICDEKKFTVENKIDKNIFAKVDKLRLNEVFNNLISNAVKYSPPGSTIMVDAHDDGDFVTVSIMDSGDGMTSEQIDHIFDEFYKADKSRHDLESSGLGLSICKRIVEKHGGSIWVESPGLGKGSMFYFTIPKNISLV